MRGSYQWALFRLVVLAVFVIPAALLDSPSPRSHAQTWLSAVEMAEPVVLIQSALLTDLPAPGAGRRSEASANWEPRPAAAHPLRAAETRLQMVWEQCQQQREQLRAVLEPVNDNATTNRRGAIKS